MCWILLRGLLTIAALLLATLVVACGGGGLDKITPEPAAQATATRPARQDVKSRECEVDLPTATLRYGDSSQTPARFGFDWDGPDCYVVAHGFVTIGIPAEPLYVPAGGRPLLVFSERPSSLRASAWTPVFESATPEADGTTISLLLELNNENRVEKRTDITVQLEESQELNFDALPPGDYAVELIGGWPEGGTSFIARVKIVAP